MAAIQSSSLIMLALHDGPGGSTSPPYGRLLLVSLALHCLAVLLVGILALSGTKMKPFIAQEVSLVSLSEESSKPRRALKQRSVIKAKVAAQRRKAVKAPSPPVKPSSHPDVSVTNKVRARSEALMRDALASLPKASPAQAIAPRQSKPRADTQLQDAMSRIELPPKTPKFKELSSLPTVQPTPALPATQAEKPSAKQLRKDVDSLLDKLKVPDMPATSPVTQRPTDVPVRVQKKPSLSEDIKNKLRSIEQLQQAKASPVEIPERSTKASDEKVSKPVREAKAVEQTPTSKKPATLIQAGDATPGSSGYLARVQSKISKHWLAPPVDLSGQSLVVVIKFRLHRSGAVSDVVVEQASGNHYYDLAAERAVRSADPLPSFPSSLSEVYLDTHFTFTVGEQLG